MNTTLLDDFEAGALLPEMLTHEVHVELGWLYARAYPLTTALERFSAALKRFAAAHGKAGLYHETITWAYLILIHERIERGGRDKGWDAFKAENPDLLARQKRALDGYYRPETLQSDLARRCFVLPDRGGQRRGEQSR
jgi:hypothetical protein